MKNIEYLIFMCISEILISAMYFTIKKKKRKNQLHTAMTALLISLFIWTLSLIMQILFQNTTIPPTIFEGFSSFGACFLPVFIVFLGAVFGKTKIKLKDRHLLLFIIPVVSTVIMFTNHIHHLFFIEYSTDMSGVVPGPYYMINSIYSYLMLGIGVIILLKYSIKNAGFFSKQSLLLTIGIMIPVILNVLGTFKIIPMTVYITPISFTITILFFFLAFFKFNFLSITPIALQRIVDQISDSYLVIGDTNNITDFNKTFLTTFKIKNASAVRGKDIEAFLKENDLYIKFAEIEKALPKERDYTKTTSFELYVQKINKYFNVEVSSILSKGQYLGTLILFKDITQHKHDIQTIKDTQDSLMESERLSSLGQLIGGIAHNLKTPIMSIAGAAEGLTDLVKEYDESIDDPTVNSQDHHEIAKDMSKWIKKIKEYSEYMSDVITAVKGQAVVMANEQDITFTISELIKRVNILMKHELKNAIINLNINCNIDENLTIHGDVNNLVQVINNMISNAIQAYKGKTNEEIEFAINKVGNNVIISIEDRAGGLPDKVKEKLFKEMITTKGKNGTGLGLYMSYSTIKAHFNGTINYETEKGVGTKFNILIPV